MPQGSPRAPFPAADDGGFESGAYNNSAIRTPNLDAGALYALRHICLAEDKKLFAFTLTPQSLKRLGSVSERYLLAHLGQGLKSLDFLKTLGEL